MGDAIHAPVHDRVRANTWPPVNQRLDTEAQLRLREAAAASSDELTKRIDRERYGLKALRGDFTAIPPAGSSGCGACVRGVEGGVRMTMELRANEKGGGAPPDRVRAHSNIEQNQRIDAQTQQCLERHAQSDREAISRHIEGLDREWDVERYLQMNAGLVSLSGVVLGALVSRRFLALPTAVFGFFFQHAAQGWCPPLPVFRRMGVRTRREINKEKYALKALRGDFDDTVPERQAARD